MKTNGWQRLAEEFVWKVEIDGYVWRCGEVPDESDKSGKSSLRESYLTPKDPVVGPQLVEGALDYIMGEMRAGRRPGPFGWSPLWEKPRRDRSYKPLIRFSGLFHTLARTNPSEDAILDFANGFGPLFGYHNRHSMLFGPPGLDWTAPANSETLQKGEPLSAWKDEINAFRHAIALWEAIRERDTARLPVLSAAGSELADDRIRWHTAAAELARVINERLHKHDSGFLFVGSWTGEPGIETGIRAENLAGALWLQLATAVAGDKTFSTCTQCGTPFEVPPKVQGRKLYCSSACRQAAHRERHGG